MRITAIGLTARTGAPGVLHKCTAGLLDQFRVPMNAKVVGLAAVAAVAFVACAVLQ